MTGQPRSHERPSRRPVRVADFPFPEPDRIMALGTENTAHIDNDPRSRHPPRVLRRHLPARGRRDGPGRHLLRAVHHRLLRTRSFRVWDEVTCAC